MLINPIVFFFDVLVAVDVMVDGDDVDNDDDNDDDDSVGSDGGNVEYDNYGSDDDHGWFSRCDGNGDDNHGCDEEWFDFCSYQF